MLLAIDTATRLASIALYDAQGVQAELTWRSRENHTVELMSQISNLIGLARVGKRDLQAVGVTLGPGSFTGLRVGLSVAKGLAVGAGASLLGIPTLDAVAQTQALAPLPIWAAVAAGRGRYSAAPYAARSGKTHRTGEYVLLDADAFAMLVSRQVHVRPDDASAQVLLCGDIDQGLASVLTQRLGAAVVVASPAANARRAGYLAELAWERHLRGEADDAGSLAPMYMPHASVEGAIPATG